jgi:hypothetical protein
VLTSFAVGKLKFKTTATLIRALMRQGAVAVEYREGRREEGMLLVEWPAGTVEYLHDANGVFEEQLRWDFYLGRKIA